MLSVRVCDLITLLIVAKGVQCKDVCVPENVDRIIVHVCETSCLHFHSILQYPPDFVYHSGSAE